VRLAIQIALGLWLGGGLLAWSTWCICTFARTTLPASADPTARLIWESGRALIWTAALTGATAIATAVGWGVARALGSGA
jgi:hypothetical protein